MGKSADNDIMDDGFDQLRADVDKMVVCSQEPTNFTEANSTYALADVAMADADFTIADGDVDGRKVTVAAKNAVNVDSSGTATHLALVDTVASKLWYVTTVTSQVLTAGNDVDIPSWKITIRDPT